MAQCSSPSAPDDGQEGPGFSQLPLDFLVLLMQRLPLRDMLAASATCQLLLSCRDQGWEALSRGRWRHWARPTSSSLMGPEHWRQLYQQRHAIDNEVFQLLEDACFPERQRAAHSRLMAQGDDAVDVLGAIAASSARSSLFIGMAYQARLALHYIRGDQAAQQVQQLLQRHREESAAAGAAAAEAGDGCDAQLMLEGALLLTQALHPLSDVGRVRCIVDDLAAELRRRMAAAAVAPGSMQAITLLNDLLFGAPATHTTPTAADSNPSTAGGIGGDSSSAVQQRWQCQQQPNASWARDDDLVGPDLSRVIVPTDGRSGLGLHGNRHDYYNLSNSCLDSVLGKGAGLPIILALLHAVVGRRAGLRVSLLNTPGQVITCARVLNETGSGGGGGGYDASGGPSAGAGGGRVLLIDVFNGGAFMSEDGFRALVQRSLPAGAQPSELQSLTRPMSFPTGLLRMLTNVMHAASNRLESSVAMAPPLCPALLQMQLVGVCIMLMELAGPDPSLLALLLENLAKGGADCSGDVLLLDRLTSRLPESLQALKSNLQRTATAVAERKEVWREWVKRRRALLVVSQPPPIPVAHHVGDLVHFGHSPDSISQPKIVVGWTLPGEPLAAGSPVAVRHDGTYSSESSQFLVWTPGTKHMTSFQADTDAQGGCERDWAVCTAGYDEERQQQLRRLRHHWFEPGDALGQQEHLQLLGDWPHMPLNYGQLFDAWWWHEGCNGESSGSHGLLIGNPYLRAMYPEG